MPAGQVLFILSGFFFIMYAGFALGAISYGLLPARVQAFLAKGQSRSPNITPKSSASVVEKISMGVCMIAMLCALPLFMSVDTDGISSIATYPSHKQTTFAEISSFILACNVSSPGNDGYLVLNLKATVQTMEGRTIVLIDDQLPGAEPIDSLIQLKNTIHQHDIPVHEFVSPDWGSVAAQHHLETQLRSVFEQ
ncbi:MAG TPA: hypothetical protein VGS08_02850 [Candidatus Saccharimonadales bacterium]|nr:hypothetical protein [Candidatus Saccharimonadales bacterium]